VYVALDDDGDDVLTAEQQARYRERIAGLTVNVDSLRRIRPARPDSIANGADDDGSGSMALLEIARNLAGRGRGSRAARSCSSGTPARRRGCSARAGSPHTPRCRATRSSRSSTST
jgi:hypothetical protein